MKRVVLIAILVFGMQAYAQKAITWFDLSVGISWKSDGISDSIAGFKEAEFSPDMRALAGKQVIITGYFLSLGTNQAVYLLSKNPMASCFFCGASGPETIMELQFIDKPSYATDDVISVKGVLYLNSDDPTHCYYRIEQAEAISLR